ncbi:hypothetical protein BJ875DRAFT_198508 [Amylocarpus encephaloides]|uniref:Uncharacterized protein n=1 Tax=Amylocarpus encephaloides TaxID=45428 RepID=A0A9P7YP97_9HELO|nr:hypothetical protein BJ875DRAFT_198508 [Amylocarpus encephaloides]
MPRFPKGFGRRKSTANALEDTPEAPLESSFKVFDRTDGGSKSFDGGLKFGKAVNGPTARPKASRLEDDNMFENIGKNRGSGASNTNTASTTDNSSRLSAASTAPSSTEECRDPHARSYGDVPLPPIPKTSSGFSLKNAGRTLSWGRHKNGSTNSPPKETSFPVAADEEIATGRSRAVTASSYASTATPPKLAAEKDLGLSMGGDFSDMFSAFGKRKSAVLEADEAKVTSQAQETNRFHQPSHLYIDRNSDHNPPVVSPYSVNSQHSDDRLISSASPPPVPQHGKAFIRPQRPGGPLDGLRRSSGMSASRQSTMEYTDAIDEDARLLRESVQASRRMNDPSYPRARDSWVDPKTSSRAAEESTVPSWRSGSVETTPRAKKAEPRLQEDDLFDSSILSSASAAQRFQNKPLSPPGSNTAPPQSKVMTPAQFERYRQDQERLKMVGGKTKAEEEDDEEEENYEDEDDDTEKNRQLAKQRRKQEAHMAVYRQQMMKVTGESASAAPPVRASVFATQSSPNLASGLGQPEEVEEEDEEVPLAILQAHGFPNKNRPPIRATGSNPNLRGTSQSTAGGVVDPRLPVFARNLPEDPYFGAGLVNPAHRESMAFHGGAGSVHGGSTRGPPPGGLVGVIASEERSRAARRGSPNTQGEYGPPPPGGFNGMGMPPTTAGSMVNGITPGMTMGPMGQVGPVGQMPMMPMLTPGDQAQIQMSQQMQQFMQMQMQFMQMMTIGGQPGQAGPPQIPQPQVNGHMSQQSLSVPRPGSPQVRPGSAQQHQRAMTMMDANAAPWMQHGSMYEPSIHAQGLGYAPSIAPSERSNIGLPGRYRPVSHAVNNDSKSRTSTMSGALGGWDKRAPASTIRPVPKFTNASDEDDEEGWEAMAKKREEKKKSKWRTKKDSSNGLKEMLGYTQ